MLKEENEEERHYHKKKLTGEGFSCNVSYKILLIRIVFYLFISMNVLYILNLFLLDYLTLVTWIAYLMD
jgi:hypothetical protein